MNKCLTKHLKPFTPEKLSKDVKDDVIILNLGVKSEGILPKNEYSNDPTIDLRATVKVGDKMEVKIVKVNDGEGQVAVTHKRIVADRGSKRLEDAFNNKEVLTAKVAQVVKGGLSVVVDDVRIFIPASLVSDVFEKDFESYKDKEIEFMMIEYDPKKRRYVGDRKTVLVSRKENMQQEVLEKIQVGDVIEGKVKNVTDFGAFVDLGGIDGLLHISEMSWGRIENPKKVFSAGDTVKVKIKEIKGNKIGLTAKFEDENPWALAASKYKQGDIVTGKIARMADFGAFVELEPGVDALLHVSQISKEHITKPSDVLAKGQEITAKIVSFDEEKQKISLSIKELLKGDDDAADEAAPEEVAAETAEAPAEVAEKKDDEE